MSYWLLQIFFIIGLLIGIIDGIHRIKASKNRYETKSIIKYWFGS